MEQPIVNYPTPEARFGSVVSVAGRDFVVMPYENHVYIPKEIVDADSKHPERGMLNHQIEWYVEHLLLDIMEYQRDALAATAVKAESTDESVVAYHVVMPVLMPVDTRDRWDVKSDVDRKAYEERLKKAMTDRKADMSTSRSYRMMEWRHQPAGDPRGTGAGAHRTGARPGPPAPSVGRRGAGVGHAPPRLAADQPRRAPTARD